MKNPKVQHIFPPEGGWKPRTLYLVEVAFNENNPIHVSTFFTGFLTNKKEPAGYNEVHEPGMHESNEIKDIFYLRAIKVLATSRELDTCPNNFKLFSEVCL